MLLYLSHPGSRTALGSKKVLYTTVMPSLSNAVTWSKVRLKTGVSGDLKNGKNIKAICKVIQTLKLEHK